MGSNIGDDLVKVTQDDRGGDKEEEGAGQHPHGHRGGPVVRHRRLPHHVTHQAGLDHGQLSLYLGHLPVQLLRTEERHVLGTRTLAQRVPGHQLQRGRVTLGRVPSVTRRYAPVDAFALLSEMADLVLEVGTFL